MGWGARKPVRIWPPSQNGTRCTEYVTSLRWEFYPVGTFFASQQWVIFRDIEKKWPQDEPLYASFTHYEVEGRVRQIYLICTILLAIGVGSAHAQPDAPVWVGFRSIMKTTAIALIVSLFTLTASSALAQETMQWRKIAESVPLGTKVKIQTLDGKRASGTLLSVDDTSVQVKRNTRRPEPAVKVTFENIANMERSNALHTASALAGVGSTHTSRSLVYRGSA